MARAQGTSSENLRLTDISSNHLSLLAWVLTRHGMDANAIFADVGVSVPTSNSPMDRVPLVSVIRTLEHVQQVLGDPGACLELYRHLKLTHLNVLGFALSCSSTLLDFFSRAERFCAYIGSAFRMEVEEREDCYQVRGGWNPAVYKEQLECEVNAGLLLECFAYSSLGIVHEVYGDPVPARAIYLPGRPHPAVVAAFERAGNAPVIIGRDFIGIDIDKDVMNLGLPGANPQLARENDQKVIEHLACFDQTDVVHRCEQLIVESLPIGEYNLKQVASRLGMSERVLQAKLRAQGQSFSGLASRIKKTLALQYLEEGKKNVGQIAYALGFDSPSNFSRAFRGWTGVSPREYKSRR